MKLASRKPGRDLPVVAITMGDPAGIGPEIIAKSMARRELSDTVRLVVVGSAPIMEQAILLTGQSLRVHSLTSLAKALFEPETIEVLDTGDLDAGGFAMGQVSADCGRAAVEYIEKATSLAMAEQVQAIVTAPINKEAIHVAGSQDIGHVEILQRLSGAKETATMLMVGPLRVVHLSTHKSLRGACAFVTSEHVLAKLRLTHQCFEDWGLSAPKIAVAALNPHGGESGLLGQEEIDQLTPAVQLAKALGINASGPFPADSVFLRAIGGEFDAVIAMYHDQGHIAVKVFNFERSVSVTLGLPFIRTSVDHGTAFDIAGKGVANPQSMIGAIRTALQLATAGLRTPED